MNDSSDILLIEDCPTQALAVRLLLQRAGYQVEVAGNGAEGWRQARANPPKLILLDLELPGMNGFQVLNRLKRGTKTSQIPVMMLTFRDHISSVLQALELGADDYLPKEDVSEQLCQAVRQLLEPAAPLALRS